MSEDLYSRLPGSASVKPCWAASSDEGPCGQRCSFSKPGSQTESASFLLLDQHGVEPLFRAGNEFPSSNGLAKRSKAETLRLDRTPEHFRLLFRRTPSWQKAESREEEVVEEMASDASYRTPIYLPSSHSTDKFPIPKKNGMWLEDRLTNPYLTALGPASAISYLRRICGWSRPKLAFVVPRSSN